jgi:integrase
VSSGEEIIYERGKYKLAWIRDAAGELRTPYPQIIWYDRTEKRTRRQSAGTLDIEAAELALDSLFEKNERGRNLCPTCGRVTNEGRYLVTEAISAYVIARQSRSSIGSIKSRLAHFVDYLTETDQLEIVCDDVSPETIEDFREWAAEVPVVSTAGNVIGDRAPGTIEATVRQLKAVVNFAHAERQTPHAAAFSPLKPEEVDRSPTYRANVEVLARMFRYCTDPDEKNPKMRKRYLEWRRNLLRYLQISVATWARPEAAHDISTDPKRDQWFPDHQAINLNPRGRAQTRKYRPVVPAARQIVPLLNDTEGFFVKVASVEKAWGEMAGKIGIPKSHGGMKLIRRSMATLARRRLGERDWIEGQIMMGHRKASKVSDIYAPFEPDYLSRALTVTEGIIDEIERLAPGAFAKLDSNSIHECELEAA